MLRLYVLRHAKSSWADPGQKDFDRPLNQRGRDALVAIRELIAERGWEPRHIFCSPTARTRQTLTGIQAAFRDAPNVSFEAILYSGDASAYLHCLGSIENGGPAMLIGHNPMCEELCEWLAGGGDETAVAKMRAKFPTGALAVFDIDKANWKSLSAGSGNLVDFIVPRELD